MRAYDELAAGEDHFARIGLPRSMNRNGHPGAGFAAQTEVDHLLEIAAAGRFAVDVGDNVVDLDPSLLGWTTGHQLPHHDLAVGPWDAVDADPAEIAG